MMLGSGFVDYGSYTGYPFQDDYVRRHGASDRFEPGNPGIVPPLSAINDAMIEFSHQQVGEVLLRRIGRGDYDAIYIVLADGSGEYTFEFPDAYIPETGQGVMRRRLDVEDAGGSMELYVTLAVTRDFERWLDASISDYDGSVTLPEGGMPFHRTVCGPGSPRVSALLLTQTETVLVEDDYDTVTAIQLDTVKRITGAPKLVPGYNMDIQAVSRREFSSALSGEAVRPGGLSGVRSGIRREIAALYDLRLVAVPGAGAGVVPCSEQVPAEGTDPRLTNIRADADGLVSLTGDSCIRVRPPIPGEQIANPEAADRTMIVENICQACCKCDDYYKLVERHTTGMQRLHMDRVMSDAAYARMRVHLSRPAATRVGLGSGAYAGWTQHRHKLRATQVSSDIIETVYFVVVVAGSGGSSLDSIQVPGADYIAERSGGRVSYRDNAPDAWESLQFRLFSADVQHGVTITDTEGVLTFTPVSSVINGVELLLAYTAEPEFDVTLTIDGVAHTVPVQGV